MSHTDISICYIYISGVLLTTNNPWGNKDCERTDSHPCKQGNTLYESYCSECNLENIKQGKKEDITFLRDERGCRWARVPDPLISFQKSILQTGSLRKRKAAR